MAEVVIDLPQEVEPLLKQLSKSELKRIVSKALKEESRELLMFKLADELLKNSELNDELAKQFGDELKQKVAKRHGLQ